VTRPHQTNKEFVEAAKISEQNAFIAVAIRRITGSLLNIPVRELVADLTFEAIMCRGEFGADWDYGEFAIQCEVCFNDLPIDWAKIDKTAKNAGYSNWFYNPDNYKIFSFLWKPFVSRQPTKKITYGEWVYLVTEKFLAPVRDEIISPADWTIETSDFESDAVMPKKIPYIFQFFANWGCLCVIVILLICLLIRFWMIRS
jgi:hypothetical protein